MIGGKADTKRMTLLDTGGLPSSEADTCLLIDQNHYLTIEADGAASTCTLHAMPEKWGRGERNADSITSFRM
jgi:hypothetical protein